MTLDIALTLLIAKRVFLSKVTVLLAVFFVCMNTYFIAFAKEFKPQLIFVSAGFDAHKDDPIGSLDLEAKDFDTMTRVVREIANEYASGKIISVLEGGYNPLGLKLCIAQHLAALGEDPL